jgi:hypothetical protein
LGLWQGATENTTVVKELLEDLVARGLDPERCYLRSRKIKILRKSRRARQRHVGLSDRAWPRTFRFKIQDSRFIEIRRSDSSFNSG